MKKSATDTAFIVLDENYREKTLTLSRLYNLPCYDADAATNFVYYLAFKDDKLFLFFNAPHTKPFAIDFSQGRMGFRAAHFNKQDELIIKACGLKKLKNPLVIDVTAGLGRDGFILAMAGCRVLMLERSKVVGALLADAITRLFDPTFSLQLVFTEAQDYLLQLKEDEMPDVIYLDPMFPPRQKSALVKKEMRILHALVGSDEDSETLFNVALNKAKHRVVVKRPRHAPLISGLKPSMVYEGRSIRFDVYVSRA